MNSRHDDALLFAKLRTTFGYSAFRPLQRDIVREILEARDVFVLMPTGGGKSLCYQLPALLLDRLIVVVSPLIALMKDQVDALRALGVDATYINSSLELAEIRRRQSAVARGEVKLLYVAPERLMQDSFLRLLSSANPACFAIDEAHCISEWGHDFRPEYRSISRLRGLFPSTTVAAFTATATLRVQADIADQLALKKACVFKGSFNRPNLFYDVRPKDRAYDQLIAYLRKHPRSSGIIYCHSRDGTERLAKKLSRDGFQAAAYHAGLESDLRRRRQEAFVRDDVPIIVATIAFGMGIDKPDVRFVVHYDLPKSLEGYYQESGRAGRDGEHSDCILFYNYADAAKHRYFIDQKPDERERRVALWQLQQMVDWATYNTCRRRALLAYFGEQLEQQADHCCDVCKQPRQEEDFTLPAQMFLSCVKRTGERFGAGHLIDILRGSRAERIVRLGHNKLPTFGIGKDRGKDEWAHLAGELRARGYLRVMEDGFKVLSITDLGNAVLFKGEQVLLTAMPPRAEETTAGPKGGGHAAKGDGASTRDESLYEELRLLRKRIADERGVPPYVIFHDSSLEQMATVRPRDRTQMLQIHGVGQRKLLDFGDEFLACIRDHARTMRGEGTQVSDTVRATVDLFQTGSDIAQIAEGRQMARSTIESHLVDAMRAGMQLPIDRLVSAEKQRSIEAAMAELGTAPLKPVLERLGEGYSYAELRFVQAMLLSGNRDQVGS